MPIARREFIRQSAAAAAGAVAGIPIAVAAQHTAVPAGSDGVKWSKAPCRFCGTGCGVMVGVKDNRVIATHGDPQAEVIAALPGACVHASAANGKLVVTLEASGAEPLIAMLGQIQALKGVLSATLVYQCADSLAAMNEDLPDADCAPRVH